jgi:hypothetical protein
MGGRSASAASAAHRQGNLRPVASTTCLAALHKIVVALAGIADMPEAQDGLKFAAYDPVRTSGHESGCVIRSIQPSQFVVSFAWRSFACPVLKPKRDRIEFLFCMAEAHALEQGKAGRSQAAGGPARR